MSTKNESKYKVGARVIVYGEQEATVDDVSGSSISGQYRYYVKLDRDGSDLFVNEEDLSPALQIQVGAHTGERNKG